MTQLLLSAANRDILAQLAWSDLLCAFDFDGTLAPIVARPDAAEMRPRTRRLLGEVAALYPTVVISGRARGDVARRVMGIPLAAILGNHGAEPSPHKLRFARIVRRWRPRLSARLAGVPGVLVEDKTISVAVHYRHARRRREALAAILDEARELPDVRIVGGKLVVNLIPAEAPHKGLALAAERARLGCDTALYVGDDDTDEDVFERDEPGRLLGVRVGSSSGSDAPYALRNQGEVDVLLSQLAQYRRRRRERG